MDKYKREYISKLDDATKRAVAFLNNLEEGNDRELEKLTLRKLMFTVLKIRNIESNNQVMRYMKWEQHYKKDKNYDDWVRRSTGNELDRWMPLLYEVVDVSDADIKRCITEKKRRKDLEEYFKLKNGVFHSNVLIYEGDANNLYAVVLYDDPYWGGENHISMRGQSKLYNDPELAQGTVGYSEKEWLEYVIADNTTEIQKMLKSYKYNNLLYVHFRFSSENVLFRAKEVVFTADERGL